MNKPVYLGLSILELSKILMYELQYDYVKPKYDRPFPKGKITKVIGLMQNELGGKIMTKFVGLRAKSYSYLIDNGSEDKKQRHKKVCHKKT